MRIIDYPAHPLSSNSFFETIADYASRHPQFGTSLNQFGNTTRMMHLENWLHVGYAVSDIRCALFFPLICLITKQVLGNDWDQFCVRIVADGQRYAVAVENNGQVKNAQYGGRYIWNIGHGVVGAIAELLVGDVLRKRGMPPMFLPLFGQAGMDEQLSQIRARFH